MFSSPNVWTEPSLLAMAGIWAVFLAVWVVGARHVHANRHVEMRGRRLQQALMIVGGALLAPLPLPWGPLAWRFIPSSAALRILAVVVSASGVAFAIWARVTLGRLWSGVVTLKEGHRLMRAGPYRFVRHPIYTGILTGIVGAALLEGEFRSLLAVGLFTFAFWSKLRVEEALLTREFGAEYEEYRRQVKALIPLVL